MINDGIYLDPEAYNNYKSLLQKLKESTFSKLPEYNHLMGYREERAPTSASKKVINRNRRPDKEIASERLAILRYLRSEAGVEFSINEIEKKFSSMTESHIDGDLKALRNEGEIVMVRRGIYKAKI